MTDDENRFMQSQTDVDDLISSLQLQVQAQAAPQVEEPQEEVQEVSEESEEAVQEHSEDDWQDPFAMLESQDEESGDKRYVIRISAPYVQLMEEYAAEERNFFINDAISYKLKVDNEEERKENLKKFTKHLFVAVLTIIIGAPIMFMLIHKSIELTVSNYSYVQKSFEKLYESKGHTINKKDLKRLQEIEQKR